MGRRKFGGFVYKRYATKAQNTVNIISHVCEFGTSKNSNIYRIQLCNYSFQSA